jgi:hypothetical protein
MLLSNIPRWADLSTEQHKPDKRYQKSERQLYLHAGSLVAMHCGTPGQPSNPKKKSPCEMDEAFGIHWTRVQIYYIELSC